MIIRLSHIAYDILQTDIRQLLPEWDGELGPQGNGISIIKVPPEELQAAVFDENDEIITAPVYSDETRYDINIHPKYEDEYTHIEFETLVEPESPDHKIYKKL